VRLTIGVLGLSSNGNIGDYLLVDATKYLLEKTAKDITLLDIDVDPRQPGHFRGVRRINRRMYRFMRNHEDLFFRIVKSPVIRYAYQYAYWHIKLHWHYSAQLKELDALVFSGGGFIKFRTQGLNYLDEQIISLATKRNIPVMMSAVGIEHYDESDVRCRRLKKVLNSPNVKVITTRDDIETLNSRYITNPQTVTAAVADPVLWLDKMTPNRSSTTRRMIGINLVNPDNFRSYGGNFSRAEVVDFYSNLLSELTNAKQKFVLFTNGMKVDHDFGRELIEKVGLSSNALVPAPQTSDEFLATLKTFDIILAGRMHAGIAASALGIPVVGLIWSNKIEMFAEIYGLRKNYFAENQLDAHRIATKLSARTVARIETSQVEFLRKRTLEYLTDFVSSLRA
jgi:polysaccharide pyruvyl transferase WcaK-like protein